MPPGGTHQHPKPLVAVSRPVGRNDVGMIAWTLTMKTPECPQGRKVRCLQYMLRVPHMPPIICPIEACILSGTDCVHPGACEHC